MIKKHFIIAIDGFSSCGKSTLARALAKELNFVFIDSGAMYRAVTLYFLRNNIDFKNNEAVRQALDNIQIDLIPTENNIEIVLNGEDVTGAIRDMNVSNLVSEVSAIAEVRLAMVKQQQRLGELQSIVMDGRDIGTTVFPHANLKIFMTAQLDVRIKRRLQELASKGMQVTLKEVQENLTHRDHMDSTREESPLRQADDAIVLDNSDMTQEEQLQFALNLFKELEGSHTDTRSMIK